mmetsp:Transcript_9428/g.10482  ORF Transcript_9428/g.10482 Transcript_9428/m.10482 type:complete len:309 (+) Transcript_9428:167-1093(+)
MTKRSEDVRSIFADNKDDDIESVVDTITSVDDISISIDNDDNNNDAGGDEKEEYDRNVHYCFGPKNNHYCSSVGIKVFLFVITVTILIVVSVVLVISCDHNNNNNNAGSNSIEVDGNGLGYGITIIPALEQDKGQHYDDDNRKVDENEDEDVHTDQEEVEKYNDFEEETTVTIENFFRDTIKPSSLSPVIAGATTTTATAAAARSRCTCVDDGRNEMICNDPIDNDVCFCNEDTDSSTGDNSSSTTVYCGTQIYPATVFSSDITYSHTFYAIDGCSCDDHTNNLLCDEYGKEQYCYCNMDGELRCEKL